MSIKGEVWLSSGNVFRGTVTVINGSLEPKVLPAGIYENTTIDLTFAPGLGPLRPTVKATTPFLDQKPGKDNVKLLKNQKRDFVKIGQHST